MALNQDLLDARCDIGSPHHSKYPWAGFGYEDRHGQGEHDDQKWVEEAGRILRALDVRRPWLVKDPRLATTLSSWLRLEDLDSPVCVVSWSVVDMRT